MADWRAIDDDPIAFLVAPESSKDFWASDWDAKPAVFRATNQRLAVFKDLFGFKQLCKLAEAGARKGAPLEFGLDVNAARYVGGRRESAHEQVADPKTLRKLFTQESPCYTLQVHQPQRQVEALWRLLAALERRLGCLVGCNAYLTPPGTQGLAPHWDDVAVWVVQCEGSKAWRVHAPPAGGWLSQAPLANAPSPDLEESGLGPVALETTLQVGDVLYLPPGTVHYARATADGPSSHLTLSSYQGWSRANLAAAVAAAALRNPALQRSLPLSLKAGLPPGLLFRAALTAPADAAPAGGAPADVVADVAAAFRSMADWLESGQVLGEDGGEMPAGGGAVLVAADALSEDFMQSRLPPHPEQLPPSGPPPKLGDRVLCRGEGLFRLVPMPPGPPPGAGSDSEEEEEEEGRPDYGAPDAFFRLLSCLRNDRAAHMMPAVGDHSHCQDGHCHHGHSHSSSDEDGSGGSEEEEEDSEEEESEEEEEGEDLAFDTSVLPALLELLRALRPDQARNLLPDTELEAVPVHLIPAPSGRDVDRLHLALALWEAGVLRTLRGEEGIGKEEESKAEKARRREREGKKKAKQQPAAKAAKAEKEPGDQQAGRKRKAGGGGADPAPPATVPAAKGRKRAAK